MRVLEIAEKLHLKENERVKNRLAEWIEGSEIYAYRMFEKYGFNNVHNTVESYRLLYILNHVCPNLYHFHKKPNWYPRGAAEMKEYNELLKLHTMENSQAGFSENGILLQEGVHYTKEEYFAFIEATKDLIENKTKEESHMTTIAIPCKVGDIIYYPTHAVPIAVRPRVTQIRITQYGVIVDAENPRTGETFCFPDSAFGKTVFTKKDKEKANELANAMYHGKR